MDKRIEKTTARAFDAALTLLAERGFSAFTMEAIAEHSGIAKSTLYRHWQDGIALLSSSLETLNRQPTLQEKLRPGELQERVVELLTHVASVMESSRVASILPALIDAAEHHPEVARFLHGYSAARRRTLVRLLQDGTKTGDLPEDFDSELAALVLSGPIFYCRLMSATRFPKKKVKELVNMVLRKN